MIVFSLWGVIGQWEDGLFRIPDSPGERGLEAQLQLEFETAMQQSPDRMAGMWAIAKTLLEAKDAEITRSIRPDGDTGGVY